MTKTAARRSESPYALPDRKVVLMRQSDGTYRTFTVFADGRAVDNVCLHNFTPCDCDYRTWERLLEESK